MNTEISKVAKWLNENFLTLNVKKTKCMLLCNSQKITRRDTDLKVYINNSLIDNIDKFKYLGVWLDPALTWNEQIDKISKTYPNVMVCCADSEMFYLKKPLTCCIRHSYYPTLTTAMQCGGMQAKPNSRYWIGYRMLLTR